MKDNVIVIESEVIRMPSRLAEAKVKKAICDSCREVHKKVDIQSINSYLKKGIVQQSTETLLFTINGNIVASISGRHNRECFLVTAFYISESCCFDTIMAAAREFAVNLYGCVFFGLNCGTIDDNYISMPGKFFVLTDCSKLT